MSQFALWLNEAFSGFDYAIASFFHSLAELSPEFFNTLFHIITLLGEEGIIMIAFGVVLLFFKKTRKSGFVVLVSILIGYLLVNVTLKPLIARQRPFKTSEELYNWWQFAGATSVGDKSFPSGHTNVVADAMFAFAFAKGKKWLLPCTLITALVGISRIYLQVHYASDVLGGILSGLISAALALLVVNLVQSAIEKHKSK